MRRVFFALFVSASVVATGCFDHQCEGDTAGPFGETQTEGDFLALDAWESSTPGGRWLDFAAGRTWTFHIPEWDRAGRAIVSTAAYVSPAEIPNAPPIAGNYDNFTPASGNLAEVTLHPGGRFEVKNDTCTQLYLRIVVRAGPPRGAAVDSGAGDAQTE